MKLSVFVFYAFFIFSSSNLYAQDNPLKQLDFFIGHWDLETKDIQPNGTFKTGKAKSSVKYILDGHAMQDDYLVLDDNEKVIFRGTSIRSFNKNTGKYQIVWIMPGIRGITDITAEFVANKLIGRGKGYDNNGEFLERFEYYNISKNSYSFKMDRSYDNGTNWIINFGTFTAKRIKNEN